MGLEISTIAAIVSAAISTVSLAISLTAKQPSMDQQDYGVGIDRRGQDNPILIPMGDCLVPAAQVYNNVNNHNTNYLAQLFCLGLGELKSINQIYINGVPFFNNTLPQTIGWHTYRTREGANKRGNSSRLTQSFHFFMFEPIFSPVNALNQPI